MGRHRPVYLASLRAGTGWVGVEISAKDVVGGVLVLATTALLGVHMSRTGLPSPQGDDFTVDAGGTVTGPVRGATIAFVDVNVVPMDSDRVLPRQIVIIEDGRIVDIGPVGTLMPPPEAIRIEGDGSQFLAPGMTDAHVHLPEGAEAWLPLFLANGVTTVFNLRGEDRHLTLRDRTRTGDVLGPRIFTSGPFTNEPEIRTPDQAARAVRLQARRGFDFVKIHGDLSEESFAAAATAAREVGIPLVGHAPRNLPFAAVLANRMDGIAHAEELIYTEFRSLDESGLEAVAVDMAMAGTWLTPTLSTFGNIVSQWGTDDGVEAGLTSDAAMHLPDAMLRDWLNDNPYTSRDPGGRDRIRAMYDFQHPMIRVLHGAGIPMLAGTDAPLPVMAPGFSLAGELESLRRAGLSNYDALVTATLNPGRFAREKLRAQVPFGTVTVGAAADLVLLARNPLIDLANLRSVRGVMLGGRWFGPEAVADMLRSARGG